ncbi:MAG: M20/M25/M40 family metallo-hydrolase [Chloroflexi bacterium]|nr:M20/M25/M40 family metallo-hydrolase [Chloroflexota bacterium]
MTARPHSNDSDLHTLIQTKREQYVDVLRELLSKSAESEEALQHEIAGHFMRLGCQVETISSAPNRFALPSDFAPPGDGPEPERVSVVAVNPGAGDGRSLFVFAHPEGEPVADTDTWQHDPFAGTIENGRMYGWAIADDLSGVVAMICAQDAIRSAGLSLSGQVTYASTVSKRRAQGIYAVLEKGYHADAALYLHPAESGEGLGDIKSRASGILRFRISVSGQLPDTGEPTHTPFSHLGVNPIDKAWVIYHAITELDTQRAQKVQHPAYEEIGRSTNLHITHIESGNDARPGRIPTSAVMTGALAFPPTEDLTDVQRELEIAVRQASDSDPWLRDHPAQLEWLQGISGVEISEDSPIYQAVAAAIEDVTGITPKVQSLHAASEIRTPILYSGIPTLGFGPLSGGNTQSGGTDEWVSVDDFINMVEVVAKVIAAWCG